MAPLILHNVPDEELYIGDDGVQRPYAVLFGQYVYESSLLLGERTSNCRLTDRTTCRPGLEGVAQ
jgi:hypothetical protein